MNKKNPNSKTQQAIHLMMETGISGYEAAKIIGIHSSTIFQSSSYENNPFLNDRQFSNGNKNVKDVQRLMFLCKSLTNDQWKNFCGSEPSSDDISEYRKLIDKEIKNVKIKYD